MRKRFILNTILSAVIFSVAATQPSTGATDHGLESLNSATTQQKSQDKVVIETDLVNITVSVNDELDRFVTGFSKEDFDLYDDGVKQDIAFFSDDDAPISMGIVYDVSGSMSGLSNHSLAMLRQFFDNSHTEDEYYIFAFNNRVQLVHDFTHLPDEIINRVFYIKPGGNTALFDAIYLAVEKVRQGRHHKKVILIFSDGEENSSRYSGRELRNLLRENDVQIYAIGMRGQFGGDATLKSITELTGGQTFFPFDQFSAEVVYTRLALMLRRQYVIGFYPNNATKGSKWHKVQIHLKAPKQLGKLKVSYRKGYWMTK